MTDRELRDFVLKRAQSPAMASYMYDEMGRARNEAVAIHNKQITPRELEHVRHGLLQEELRFFSSMADYTETAASMGMTDEEFREAVESGRTTPFRQEGVLATEEAWMAQREATEGHSRATRSTRRISEGREARQAAAATPGGPAIRLPNINRAGVGGIPGASQPTMITPNVTPGQPIWTEERAAAYAASSAGAYSTGVPGHPTLPSRETSRQLRTARNAPFATPEPPRPKPRPPLLPDDEEERRQEELRMPTVGVGVPGTSRGGMGVRVE